MERLAIVFPGQGSQSVGMLQSLAERFPLVRETFEEASARLGYDLWAVVSEGPEAILNQTIYTQPAMLAAGVAAYRVYLSQDGEQPTVIAGHSLGEYSALVAAQSVDFADAIHLVHHRARLMQETIPQGQGAMAAIVGLDNDAIADICQQAAQGQIVEPANFNAIGQTVIAGETDAVDRAVQLAQTQGAKLAQVIPVSVPCHCRLLSPAADAFKQYLAETTIKTPLIPVISNVNVQAHSDSDHIRDLLAQQLYSSVRWVETIQAFAEQGIERVIEMGPGRVLTGLCKRIDRSLQACTIENELATA